MTWAKTVLSKDVERESPMCASSSQGNVCCRNARLEADPHVVNTFQGTLCQHICRLTSMSVCSTFEAAVSLAMCILPMHAS